MSPTRREDKYNIENIKNLFGSYFLKLFFVLENKENKKNT